MRGDYASLLSALFTMFLDIGQHVHQISLVWLEDVIISFLPSGTPTVKFGIAIKSIKSRLLAFEGEMSKVPRIVYP